MRIVRSLASFAVGVIVLVYALPLVCGAAVDREVIDLVYTSIDGRSMPAVLSIPKGPGPFPVVVTIHGGVGGRDQSHIRSLAAPGGASSTVNALNAEPWAILAISYRGQAILGLEEDDVVWGIRFAKTLERIDPNRVGVIGGSHGGHLALRAAQVMGDEIVAVAAGSPWMVNPQVHLYGRLGEPPLSDMSRESRQWLLENRMVLRPRLEREYGVDGLARRIQERSIEANAEKIVVPVLFLTSLSDVQVPHVTVQPTIERLERAGKQVTVYTAKESAHGFYWGRNMAASLVRAAREDAIRLEEKQTAIVHILDFFRQAFGGSE